MQVRPVLHRRDKESPQDRPKEHNAATVRGELEISVHCRGCLEPPSSRGLGQYQMVLDEVANSTTLFIKEALHICSTD